MKTVATVVFRDEELLLGFCIDALLSMSELSAVVAVNDGSNDASTAILHALFRDEMNNGRLIVYSTTQSVLSGSYDISIARNLSIEVARNLGADFIFRADADEVFIPWYGDDLIRRAHSHGGNLAGMCTHKYELYQFCAHTESEWLSQMEATLEHPDGYTFLYARRGDYTHHTIYRARDAVAHGKWTDEAHSGGTTVEGIYNPNGGDFLTYRDRAMTHFGWAKPVHSKEAKELIWRKGIAGMNPRVKTLHMTEPRKLRTFHARHIPDPIHERFKDVKRLLET